MKLIYKHQCILHLPNSKGLRNTRIRALSYDAQSNKRLPSLKYNLHPDYLALERMLEDQTHYTFFFDLVGLYFSRSYE